MGSWLLGLFLGALALPLLLVVFRKEDQAAAQGGPLAPPDQGPRGAHLGWFEARLCRVLHLDVLDALVATRDHLLVLRIGGQGSGLNGASRLPPEVVMRAQNLRRASLGERLAEAADEARLRAEDAEGQAIPWTMLRTAEVRRYRQIAWRGVARLRIDWSGGPPLNLLLEDAGQLAACVRALEGVLGGVLRVDPRLRPWLADPELAIRRWVARAGALPWMVFLTMTMGFVALICAIALAQQPHQPLQAATGALRACKKSVISRDRSELKLVLDQPPHELRMDLDGTDDLAMARACREGALVNVLHDQGQVRAISYFDGRDIISVEQAERRLGWNNFMVGLLAGIFGATSLAVLIHVLRRRRRLLARKHAT